MVQAKGSGVVRWKLAVSIIYIGRLGWARGCCVCTCAWCGVLAMYSVGIDVGVPCCFWADDVATVYATAVGTVPW